MRSTKRQKETAAEVQQAIWNIFVGDTVRLRKKTVVGSKKSKKSLLTNCVVLSVSEEGHVKLDGEIDGTNWWNIEDLVVVKQGPGTTTIWSRRSARKR